MRRYDIPPADVVKTVRTLIDGASPRRVGRMLSLTETTIARLAAGLPVMHETIEIVRNALVTREAA